MWESPVRTEGLAGDQARTSRPDDAGVPGQKAQGDGLEVEADTGRASTREKGVARRPLRSIAPSSASTESWIPGPKTTLVAPLLIAVTPGVLNRWSSNVSRWK